MIAEGDWGTKEKTTQTEFQKTTPLAQLSRKVLPFVSKAVANTGHVQTTEAEVDLA